VKASRTTGVPDTITATLDGLRTITVHLVYAVPALRLGQVAVHDSNGAEMAVADVAPVRKTLGGKARSYTVHLVQPANIERQSLRIDIEGFCPCPVLLGRILCNRRFFDAEARLGATTSPQGTLFSVFAPDAESVEVVIAKAATGRVSSAHPMTKNRRGVWSVTVENDLRGRFYAYRLHGPGLDPRREVVDPYAVGAQYPGPRAMIANLADTDPPGFDASAHVTTPSIADAVIYEMSVRDFTIAADSGVKNKGRYLGLSETGTHLPGDSTVRTGLDHLVELGVTHVQLLPVQCFEDDGKYNWGYMTVFFNTPEARYATTPDGDVRIREFKQMVEAFHACGIGVVLDVVYNHASEHATFDRIAPGYYFRTKPGGALWNGSGCGNEMRTEHPMCRKFILDSLKYWVAEYGIDGFRFDLMGLMDFGTLEAIRDELHSVHPSILLYGEPWTSGPAGLRTITDKNVVRGSGIAAFNDHFRDAIKGSTNGQDPGFVQAGDHADGVRAGIRGAVQDWAADPTDVVNYCACHDNLTMHDKVTLSAPAASDRDRARMHRLAALILMTSQGAVLLHSGDEFCRSKKGHHNSYNLGDEVNRVEWSLKKTHQDVYEYHRGLIALRRAHPVFRLPTREEVERRVHLMNDVPSPRCIAFALDGRELVGEAFSTTLVLLNADSTERKFPLGPGRWLVAADADRASHLALAVASGSVALPPHSGMILHK